MGGVDALQSLRIFPDVRFFIGGTASVPSHYSLGVINKKKNGTARRPSLPNPDIARPLASSNTRSVQSSEENWIGGVQD